MVVTTTTRTAKRNANNNNNNNNANCNMPNRPRRRRGRANRGANNQTVIVGANQAMVRVNNPTGGRREDSSDLISALQISPDVKQGDLLLDLLVTPSIAPRLKALSIAWQRLRYHKLLFEVNASSSSAVGGEFVAAFIADPTDKPPMKNADRWVKAHAGSITSNWWKSINVRGPVPPQMMYTSFEASEPRFSSPGRFVLAVINPPTAQATMSVSLNWGVTFAQPSLEVELESAEDNIYILQKDTRLYLTDGSHGQEFYKYLGHDPFDEDPKTTISPRDFKPTLPKNVFLPLAAPKTLVADTGATGAPESAVVTHIGVASDSDNGITYYVTEDGKTFKELTPEGVGQGPFSIRPMGDAIIEKGTIFEADPRSPALTPESVFTQRRSRRSLTSEPVLTRLQSGKTLTFLNSKRF